MNDKIKEFLENANESIESFDARYEEGMTHEEQADFASGTFRELLLDAIEILEAQTSDAEQS